MGIKSATTLSLYAKTCSGADMDECAAETLEGVDYSRSHMLVRYLSHGSGKSIMA